MSTELSVAILGATGPVGRHVAESALRAGHSVAIASRNEPKLVSMASDMESSVESLVVDIASDTEMVRRVAQRSDVVVVAAGVDPANLGEQVDIARAVVNAAPRRLLYVSSCWSFAPLQASVLNEDHPRPGHGMGRFRRESEDIVLDSGGTVLHLPDFFGPTVHTSPLQRVIQVGLSGRRVTWPAGASVAREHAYIKDIGDIVLRAIASAPAGANFILPGSGPITFEDMVEHISTLTGRRVRSNALGWLPIPILRTIDSWSRHLGDALTEYRKPVEYDASRLLGHTGPTDPTPYRAGISNTIHWQERVRSDAII